jgi:hypothetical protein
MDAQMLERMRRKDLVAMKERCPTCGAEITIESIRYVSPGKDTGYNAGTCKGGHRLRQTFGPSIIDDPIHYDSWTLEL